MNLKRIVIVSMVLLLVLGPLSCIFAGGQQIPNVGEPEGGDEVPGGGQPSGNDDANQSTNITPPSEIETGDLVVSSDSQDLILVRRVNETNDSDSDEENPEVIEEEEEPVQWAVEGDQRDGQGEIQFIPITSAGTIPHIVRMGENSQIYAYAYCLEPRQSNIPNTNLAYGGNEESAVILQTIYRSNPSDTANAVETQYKIWVLVSGGNVAFDQGEVAELISSQGITQEKLENDISSSKESIKREYGVTDQQLPGLLEYKKVDIIGLNLIENFITMIKHALGIYPNPAKVAEMTGVPENETNNTSSNNTQTNNTNTTNNTTDGPSDNDTNDTDNDGNIDIPRGRDPYEKNV